MTTPFPSFRPGVPPEMEAAVPWTVEANGTVKMRGHFRVSDPRKPGKTYSSARQHTTQVPGRPGSQTHTARVAQLYAEWVAKMQGCSLTVWTLGEAIEEYKRDGGARGKGVSDSAKWYLEHLSTSVGTLKIGKPLRRWWDGECARLRKAKNQHTVNKMAAILRAVLQHAVLKERIETVPIRHWGISSVPARDYVLTDQQLQNLLTVIDKRAPHLSAITRFAVRVPSRTKELVGMRREHLDLFRNRIMVPGAMSKSGRMMYKPIPPEQKDYFRTLPEDTDYLFYRRDLDGIAQPLGDFKRAWLGCMVEAGLKQPLPKKEKGKDRKRRPGFRFHDLRHMAVTNLSNAGTPDNVIMQVAGWRTNMMQTYYHQDAASLELVQWGESSESVATDAVAGGEK